MVGMKEAGPEALLLTGIYGVGKSSMATEIADLLELRGIGYALLDLDFLNWFDAGRDDGPSEDEMLRANLVPVVGNYLGVGIRRFLVVGTLADAGERDTLVADLDMPVRVVRLTLRIEEIERRLGADVTAGRAADLHEARAQLERSDGVGIEDLAISNDRPIREIATEILDWLGWEMATTPSPTIRG